MIQRIIPTILTIRRQIHVAVLHRHPFAQKTDRKGVGDPKLVSDPLRRTAVILGIKSNVIFLVECLSLSHVEHGAISQAGL